MTQTSRHEHSCKAPNAHIGAEIFGFTVWLNFMILYLIRKSKVLRCVAPKPIKHQLAGGSKRTNGQMRDGGKRKGTRSQTLAPSFPTSGFVNMLFSLPFFF